MVSEGCISKLDKVIYEDIYEEFGMTARAGGVKYRVEEWVKEYMLRGYTHLRRIPDRLVKRALL